MKNRKTYKTMIPAKDIYAQHRKSHPNDSSFYRVSTIRKNERKDDAICSIDGMRWEVVALDERKPNGRCVINRFTPDGHVVIEGHIYEHIDAALKAATEAVKKYNASFQHDAELTQQK